jgi:hypothetical protein
MSNQNHRITSAENGLIASPEAAPNMEEGPATSGPAHHGNPASLAQMLIEAGVLSADQIRKSPGESDSLLGAFWCATG